MRVGHSRKLSGKDGTELSIRWRKKPKKRKEYKQRARGMAS